MKLGISKGTVKGIMGVIIGGKLPGNIGDEIIKGK